MVSDPRKKLTQLMLQALAKKYPGDAADSSIAYAFEALLIVADAYKRAGSAKPEALVEALHAAVAGRDIVG